MLTADMITSLMNKEGPVVKAVVLRASGVVDEVSIDMTPKKNELVKLLGGSAPSIVGQFSYLEAVLLKKQDPGKKDKKNTHKLPHPLHEEEHVGDLVLVRMNKEAEPENFSKKDWTDFLKDAPFTPEAYEAWKIKYNVTDEDEEDDEDDVEEDDEDEEDEDDDDMDEEDEIDIESFLKTFRASFKEEHKRLPTKEEEAEVLDLLQNGGNDEEDEDDDEEDGIDVLSEEETQILEKVLESLSKKLKREPTDEEVEAALQKTPGGDVIIAKMSGADDDDDDVEELDEEEEEILEKVLESLTKKLKRDPTDEEVEAALEKVPGGDVIIAKMSSNEGDDEDVDEEDDDEEDDDEEELDEKEEEILHQVLDSLAKKLKREPTDEEVEAELEKIPGGDVIIAKVMSGDDDEDLDVKITEEEEALLNKTAAELSRKLKRPVKEEEIMAALLKKPGGPELLAKIGAFEEDDEGEDEEDEDEEDEEEEDDEPAPVVTKKPQQKAQQKPQQKSQQKPQQKSQQKPQQQQQSRAPPRNNNRPPQQQRPSKKVRRG